MFSLQLPQPPDRPLRILCLGAHADDIEIGCGGTILRLLEEHPSAAVRWDVFSAQGERAEEARASAAHFLEGAAAGEVTVHAFRDGFFPYQGKEIKAVFEGMKDYATPDVIFTHQFDDRHQDHRILSELTWNTFRNHTVLEYEIPKYDGGLETPNLYVAIRASIRERKIKYITDHFPSQRSKHWFTAETFTGLMRLRGVESACGTGYAEGFHARKLILSTDEEVRAGMAER